MTALGTSTSNTARLISWMVGAGLILGACAPAAPAAPTAAPTAAAAKPAATTAPAAAPAAKPTEVAKPAAPAATAAPAAAKPSGTTVPAGADWEQKWDQLVAAAKQEGEVVIYGPPGADYRTALVEPFERAFPGIKVSFTGASGSQAGPRLMTERQAGKFIADLHIGGTTTMNDMLKPAGALDPIPPLLLRPDVTDAAKWYQNKLWYADNEQQFNLMFEGGVSQIIAVNKDLVDPKTFTSYWDILDPKYKGKLVASDIRKPGPGGGQSRFIWATEGLGAPFLEKLFGDMDIALTEDRRQLADWLAQGRFAISIFPGTDEIDSAIEQGLPLAYVDNRNLKEGFPVSAAFGSVAVINQRPHPNAAQVYLNWLLSPDGQAAWQKALGANSMRTDIPKDTVNPLFVPPPGGGDKVFFASLERYASLELKPIRDTISKALEKKQQ